MLGRRVFSLPFPFSSVTLSSDSVTEIRHVQEEQGGEVFRRQNYDARIWNQPPAVGIEMQGRMQNSPDRSLERVKDRVRHVGNLMRVPSPPPRQRADTIDRELNLAPRPITNYSNPDEVCRCS